MSRSVTSAGAVVDERFLLERQIGRGGTAAIWLATDLRSLHPVALKLLHPGARAIPRTVERFAREANVLLSLEHPAIARAVEVGFDRVQPYIAMEHVAGTPLDQDLGLRAEAARHYGREELLAVFGTICDAVAFAHGRGVIHRDLKPSNVIVEESGATVKVLDFGIAKLLDDPMWQETTQGRMVGSIAYMAPEQARGEAIDARVDVFALGVVLFEMLTLRRAWARDESGQPVPAYTEPVRTNAYNNFTATLARAASEPRVAPSAVRRELGGAIDAVVLRALAPDRELRWPTAAALLDALRAAAHAIPVSTRRPERAADVEPRAQTATAVRPEAPTRVRDEADGPDDEVTATFPGAQEETALATILVDQEPTSPGVSTAVTKIRERAPAEVEDRTRIEPDGARPRGPALPKLVFAFAAGSLATAAAVIGLWRESPPAAVVPAKEEPVARPAAEVSARRVEEPPRPAAEPAVVSVPEPPPDAGSALDTTGTKARPRPAPAPASTRVAKPQPARRPARAGLRELVAAVEAKPGDATLLARARAALLAAAGDLPDAAARSRIARIIESSAMLGDVRGLERARQEIEASRAP